MIELIPAIDLIDGKCVRLTQGDYDTKKVYNEDPLEVAKMFEAHGIRRLHVVDLDGARQGRIINYRVLERLATRTALVIDFGGGLKQEDDLEKLNVCRFPKSESEIPASMEENGFTNVTTGYAIIDLTPDAPKYSAKMAELMIEAMRQNDLESIQSTRSDHAGEIISVIDSKYEERIRLYRAGMKQWDTSVSVTMIVRGMK